MYNNGYTGDQPLGYGNPWPYGGQMPQGQTQQQPPTRSIQRGGIVLARDEAFARNYPVAPGVSIMFKDEYRPYVYEKTMGFSQLDVPIFVKYKLVREEAPVQESQNAPTSGGNQGAANNTSYALAADLEALKDEIAQLRESIANRGKEGEQS